VQVFVDTGYFYARLDEHDQEHERTREAVMRDVEAVTSSLVVSETITLLQNRGMFSTALSFLGEIRYRSRIRIIHVDPVLQAEAWDLFGKWGPSGAAVVDCASFAIMRSLGIKRAFSFDWHFRAAGFEILE
jgi:predicted nucleic acid-binding protein